MKKKTMRRLLYIVAIPLLLILSYKVYMHVEYDKQYKSLDNVFKEMNYAEVYPDGLVKLPSLGKVLGSYQGLRIEDTWAGFRISNPLLESQEYTKLNVYREGIMLLEYRRQLSDNSYLFISWYYTENSIQEIVSIAFSDISDTYVKQVMKHEEIVFQEKGVTNKEDVYRRRATIYTGQPSLNSKSEILSYLKPYGISEEWLKKKSDFVLNDVLLKPWFEKGSQRYSFDNLGNVKIERLDTFK
ncbi:TipC family immunity protein [Streptococcus cuniculi]|uniref:TipC family immunity protein n=1 Tax=Streptococcus cuniculi TaxID=1432788 RepID=A0A4Y9JB13_9STRE|nr:TipC family immunity protein [Streptococcus cuniculi]MBF0779027.1 TipC family immunity protein [Streptococcus cuniculi]TFU96995.1 hypothetical protein E4T82_09935 [Streptococcus cuniculi]